MNRLKFPVGIPDFKKIREKEYCYVDKTSHIHQLIDQGEYYFLSRPRRFGKSLLLNTMKHLFEGNESLFQGLDIYDQWDWSTRHPVVRLSFDANYTEVGNLEANVMTQLELLEIQHGIEVSSKWTVEQGPNRLLRLIHDLHAKTGQQVVVLVDEYDKPILDVIKRPEMAQKNRDYLRGFYGVIKGSAEHVRFVFVTGISMFSKVSLFSGLNNLEDISLNPQFATICGYTESDLDTVFAPVLEGFDRDKIRTWYNGYSWRGEEKVYNPYDVLMLLKLHEFGSHWFVTGTPTFLYEMMKQQQFSPLNVENLQVTKEFISKFDVDDISTEALMFQTGYLTIVGEQHAGATTKYTLDYPNLEVRENLNQGFLEFASNNAVSTERDRAELCELLIANDFDGFAERLLALLNGIPYHWQKSAELSRYEAWYAALLYACFQSRSYDLRVEEASSRGRSDMVVSHGSQVFVFELKMAESEEKLDDMAKAAIGQIQARGYADKYRGQNKVIHLLGLALNRDTEDKVAVAMKVEQY